MDTTRHVYQMADGGRYYVLSRPRRFGKSLLVSTLKCLFHGRRATFLLPICCPVGAKNLLPNSRYAIPEIEQFSLDRDMTTYDLDDLAPEALL